MKTFAQVYSGVLNEALQHGVMEANERTGENIYVLEGARSFTLDLSDNRLPLPNLRKIHVKSAAAEVAWFLSGRRDIAWMVKYAPFWDKFLEADGTVRNAYGYRWREHFGRDQIAKAIEALIANRSDRRIYISAWDPAQDGLGNPGKNVPCPVGFTLSITNNKLHSTMLVRSSDLFVGLPYDVLGHAILMSLIRYSLGKVMPSLGLGTLTFTLAHPHLYMKHQDMVIYGLTQLDAQITVDVPKVYAPAWDIEDVEAAPDRFVEAMHQSGQTANWPEFNPRPEIIP